MECVPKRRRRNSLNVFLLLFLYFIKKMGILNIEYVNNVRFSLEFPLTELEAVKAELIDTTNGQAIVDVIQEGG